jgi:hypothetical protein
MSQRLVNPILRRAAVLRKQAENLHHNLLTASVRNPRAKRLVRRAAKRYQRRKGFEKAIHSGMGLVVHEAQPKAKKH